MTVQTLKQRSCIVFTNNLLRIGCNYLYEVMHLLNRFYIQYVPCDQKLQRQLKLIKITAAALCQAPLAAILFLRLQNQ